MDIQPDPRALNDRWVERRKLWIDPKVWMHPDMRPALARRDITMVYRILQRYGISQRRIAALTDQSQSEVSEIVSGKRHVVSYDVLVRIADGLDVPPGWMGLAQDPGEPTIDREA